MIETKYGMMDEALLEKREGTFDNPNDFGTFVEYWKDGELVHRSATTNIKMGACSSIIAGMFS